MIPASRKRLIEVDFPIGAVSAHSARMSFWQEQFKHAGFPWHEFKKVEHYRSL